MRYVREGGRCWSPATPPPALPLVGTVVGRRQPRRATGGFTTATLLPSLEGHEPDFLDGEYVELAPLRAARC